MRHTLCAATFLSMFLGLAVPEMAAQEVDPEVFAAWSLRNNLGPGSNWRDHLDVVPGLMGPNALPVNDFFAGKLSTRLQIAAEHAQHFTPGERSSDAGIRLLLPFGENVNVRVRYVLREWYNYDDSLALLRNTLQPAGKGSTSGDVLIDMLMQLAQQDKFPLNVMLGLHVKTASGEGLEAMRFTDSPGYAIDMLLSRDIGKLRLYGGGGFYVWQRFSLGAPQNDAYSYAGGVSYAPFGKTALAIRSELAGYSGWTLSPDDPLIWRTVLEWQPEQADWFGGLWIEKGFQDAPYNGFRLVLGRQINWTR